MKAPGTFSAFFFYVEIMEILQAEFVLGAATPEHLPKTSAPEVAFMGRSNVGKSSLLNSLVRRKQLALVSSTPGKTKQINFFLVNDTWMFADLPGFGYAQVPKTEREQWQAFTKHYLHKREQLRLVCLLVDSRHDPSALDISMMEDLEMHGRHFVVILTKTDKIGTEQIRERKEQVEEVLQYCQYNVEVLPYSSRTNLGRENLLAIIKRVSSST